MRSGSSNSFNSNMFVKLKNQDWLLKQRVAGDIAAKVLLLLQSQVESLTTLSTNALSQMADEFILDHGGTATFKGYKGFPAAVCISVNRALVHGIPNDKLLVEGDVISFDLGVTYQGAIADTAITCIYGTPKTKRHVDLIAATEESLMQGIQAIGIDKHLGVIGNAIFKSMRHKGFSLVTAYGGHGLDWDSPHASPFVANKADPDEGIRIQPGLSIAVEPQLVIGPATTKVLSDGWTVITDDIGAHFEHSLFVHPDRVEIVTWREGSSYPREYFFNV